MDILIIEYGFVPNEGFLKRTIPIMTFDMFNVFYNNFDLSSYGVETHNIFKWECADNKLDNVKAIVNMEYNINILNTGMEMPKIINLFLYLHGKQ